MVDEHLHRSQIGLTEMIDKATHVAELRGVHTERFRVLCHSKPIALLQNDYTEIDDDLRLIEKQG